MGSPPRSLKLSLLSVLLVELAWQLHPQWRHSFGAKSVPMLVKVQSIPSSMRLFVARIVRCYYFT